MELFLVDLGYDGIEPVVFTTFEKAQEYALSVDATRVLQVIADKTTDQLVKW